MIYVHRPTEIDAIQFTGENIQEMTDFCEDYTPYLIQNVMHEPKIYFVKHNSSFPICIEMGQYLVRKGKDYKVYSPETFERYYMVKE